MLRIKLKIPPIDGFIVAQVFQLFRGNGIQGDLCAGTEDIGLSSWRWMIASKRRERRQSARIAWEKVVGEGEGVGWGSLSDALAEVDEGEAKLKIPGDEKKGTGLLYGKHLT